MFSTTIQREGKSPHRVEERPDTRNGGTYLWCDCPGWKFAQNKGGCVHVRLAREEMEADSVPVPTGSRIVDLTPEQQYERGLITDQELAAATGFVATVTEALAPLAPAVVVAPAGALTTGPEVRAAAPDTGFISPMLAAMYPTDGNVFPAMTGEWVYEAKLDGHRMIAVVTAGKARMFSRPGNLYNEPLIRDALEASFNDVILDGELVWVKDGKENRHSLASRMGATPQQVRDHLRLVIFDVMRLGGYDTKGWTYTERRAALERLPLEEPLVLVPASTDGPAMWDKVMAERLEGLIAKPPTSRYLPGERGTWKKLKRFVSEELYVVGWTPGGPTTYGERPFGSLVLARRVEDTFRFVGHVGTGFTGKELTKVADAMAPLKTDIAPFDGIDLRKANAKQVTWLEPILTATIVYNDANEDGTLLMASWKGFTE